MTPDHDGPPTHPGLARPMTPAETELWHGLIADANDDLVAACAAYREWGHRRLLAAGTTWVGTFLGGAGICLASPPFWAAGMALAGASWLALWRRHDLSLGRGAELAEDVCEAHRIRRALISGDNRGW